MQFHEEDVKTLNGQMATVVHERNMKYAQLRGELEDEKSEVARLNEVVLRLSRTSEEKQQEMHGQLAALAKAKEESEGLLNEVGSERASSLRL